MIAASTRSILFGGRGLIALWILGVIAQNVGVLPDTFPGFTAILAIGIYWWFELRHSVWIDPEGGTIKIRKRSPWRMRQSGEVLTTYPRDASVAVDSAPPLWRVDLGLTIDGVRYAVLPENHNEAIALAAHSS